MPNDLTPERARTLLDRQWGHPSVMDTVDAVLAAWERDRAELEKRRRECVTCGSRNLTGDGVHSCYDRDALLADARAELARVRAQRDALVPLGKWDALAGVCPTVDQYAAARAALAAIRAEQEGRGDD